VVYYPPIADEAPLRFAEFKTSYRGFEIGKTPEHQLYFLFCPQGKMLPAELSCKFTKFVLLQAAIDSYLDKHPEAILPDVVIPKPKRSHHNEKKKEEVHIT
jgi:hypothetical protein